MTGLVKTDGSVYERYAYDAYGAVGVLEADFSADPDNIPDGGYSGAPYGQNEILYCGYRHDPESGMYHIRHRYYHPRLGRWINRDPVGYRSGSLNLAEYCDSIPLITIDPFGLDGYGDEPGDDNPYPDPNTIEVPVGQIICAGAETPDWEGWHCPAEPREWLVKTDTRQLESIFRELAPEREPASWTCNREHRGDKRDWVYWESEKKDRVGPITSYLSEVYMYRTTYFINVHLVEESCECTCFKYLAWNNKLQRFWECDWEQNSDRVTSSFPDKEVREWYYFGLYPEGAYAGWGDWPE